MLLHQKMGGRIKNFFLFRYYVTVFLFCNSTPALQQSCCFFSLIGFLVGIFFWNWSSFPPFETQVLCGLNFFFEVLPLFSELNGRVTRPPGVGAEEGEGSVPSRGLKRWQDTCRVEMKKDGWKRWRWYYRYYFVSLSLLVILTLLKVPTM